MRRSEVRFLVGIQIFLSNSRDKTTEKHLSLFLYRTQNLPSLLFYLLVLSKGNARVEIPASFFSTLSCKSQTST